MLAPGLAMHSYLFHQAVKHPTHTALWNNTEFYQLRPIDAYMCQITKTFICSDYGLSFDRPMSSLSERALS